MTIDTLNHWAPVWRGLVANGKHYKKIKSEIWLLLYFITSAHPRSGKLVTKISTISQDLQINPATVLSWTGHLKKKGYIHVRRERGFETMVVSINKWKPALRTTTFNLFKRITDINNSHNKNSMQTLKPNTPVKPLALEITKAFGEEDDLDFYQDLFNDYHEGLIQRAYDDTMRVPAFKITKSRKALFLYLLNKYEQNKNDQDS